MKVFRLSCEHGHDFEGWFSSTEDFAQQLSGGKIACPVCESQSVDRLPSAPYVNTGARPPAVQQPAAPATLDAMAGANPELAKAIATLRGHILANTENVGARFAEVARRMHYGEEETRGIRGRVSPDEAVALHEEGIDAHPLPPGLGLGEDVH